MFFFTYKLRILLDWTPLRISILSCFRTQEENLFVFFSFEENITEEPGLVVVGLQSQVF